MGREGGRILGWNKDGESQWFEGNTLPEHWSKQDPTQKKPAEAGQVISEPEAVPVEAEPEQEAPAEAEEPVERGDHLDTVAVEKPAPVVEETIERGNLTPEAEPAPPPAPAPVEKPKAKKKKIELDEDGDEPMPGTNAPVEPEKRKPGRQKRGD